MNLSDFNYNLPKELIAQYPSDKRDESRLLVLHKDTGNIEHRIFKDIIEYFTPQDSLILNDTKVFPARLIGRKDSGGKVDVLLLGPVIGSSGRKSAFRDYEVLLKPTRGCRIGARLIFGDGKLIAQVTNINEGRRFIQFEDNGDIERLLEEVGEMPLPPYIKRDVEPVDRERYQTVYAKKNGAIAAPTAGLHFTDNVLKQLKEKGVDIEYVTLHVGYGTFKLVKSEDIQKHKMEKEYFEIEDAVVNSIKNKKGRIFAVGTTTCRALETAVDSENGKDVCRGWTDLFVYPGYRFKAVDALLTNFHLPKTTLLMLVSALCGRKLLFKAYEEAIERKYRFYSYGDAMLVL